MSCSKAKKADCLSRSNCKWENSRCKNNTGAKQAIVAMDDEKVQKVQIVQKIEKVPNVKKVQNVENKGKTTGTEKKPRCSKARKADCVTYPECKWDKRCIIQRDGEKAIDNKVVDDKVVDDKKAYNTKVVDNRLGQETKKETKKETRKIIKCSTLTTVKSCYRHFQDCYWRDNKCRQTIKMPFPSRGLDLFSINVSDTVHVHRDLNKACPISSRSYSKTLTAFDSYFTAKLTEYHRDWMSGADPLALFKANFAVDYFATQVMTSCNSDFDNVSVSDINNKPQGAHYKDTIFQWDGSYSFELFKTLEVDYATALQKGLDFVQELYHDLESKCVRFAMGGMLLPEYMTRLVTEVLNAKTVYNANAYSIYRTVNMYATDYPIPVNNPVFKVIRNKFPINCITRSLLTITLLLLGGIERQALQVVTQKKTSNPLQQTHWASACSLDNIVIDLDVHENMEQRRIPLDSTVTFSKYTREMIYYYITFCGQSLSSRHMSSQYLRKKRIFGTMKTMITNILVKEGKINEGNLVTPYKRK